MLNRTRTLKCVSLIGLLRLQQLYQSLQPGNATFRISNVKRVSNATDVIAFLGSIERLDRWSNKYVVLDSTTQLAKEALILHVRDVRLGRRNYHYFLSGLVSNPRVKSKPNCRNSEEAEEVTAICVLAVVFRI